MITHARAATKHNAFHGGNVRLLWEFTCYDGTKIFSVNHLGYNAIVFIKVTRRRPLRLSAVLCRTLWTVKCSTTVASTRLKTTTWGVTMATDRHSGSSASNRTVCVLWNVSCLLRKLRNHGVKLRPAQGVVKWCCRPKLFNILALKDWTEIHLLGNFVRPRTFIKCELVHKKCVSGDKFRMFCCLFIWDYARL